MLRQRAPKKRIFLKATHPGIKPRYYPPSGERNRLGLPPYSRRTEEVENQLSLSVGHQEHSKGEEIKPSPQRGNGTWNEFLKLHVDTLWQVNFFSKMIWTSTGLKQAFVLAFIHVGTRPVFCSPCSFKPDTKWMVSQAHAFTEQAREADLGMEYLIRDRDGMYVQAFEQFSRTLAVMSCKHRLNRTIKTPI